MGQRVMRNAMSYTPETGDRIVAVDEFFSCDSQGEKGPEEGVLWDPS